MQVNTQQPASVDSWHWAAADLKLLLQQFRGLKVTQQYKLTQQQLTALGPEGKAPLARVEMEMLGKVVNDFLVQLGAQPSGEPSAAGSAAAMSQPDADDAEVGHVDPVGPPSEGTSAHQGSYGHAQAGKGFRGSPGKTLTSSQIKKKKEVQQQREQLKAGEACLMLMLMQHPYYRSIAFTVQVRKPVVTHWASWLQSKGECIWQPKAADQVLPERENSCSADEVLNQTRNCQPLIPLWNEPHNTAPKQVRKLTSNNEG